MARNEQETPDWYNYAIETGFTMPSALEEAIIFGAREAFSILTNPRHLKYEEKRAKPGLFGKPARDPEIEKELRVARNYVQQVEHHMGAPARYEAEIKSAVEDLHIEQSAMTFKAYANSVNISSTEKGVVTYADGLKTLTDELEMWEGRAVFMEPNTRRINDLKNMIREYKKKYK